MKEIYAFVDTETTGLLRAVGSERQPYLTELCAIKTDHKFKIIDEFTTFISSPEPLPYFITKITGIDDQMLISAPPFKKIYKPLKSFFVGVDIFVGHNAMFDYRMIEEQAKRIDKKQFLPINVKCTIEMSMHIKGYRLKLDELYFLATGEPSIPGQHRAKNDVLATIKCYKWLNKNRG